MEFQILDQEAQALRDHLRKEEVPSPSDLSPDAKDPGAFGQEGPEDPPIFLSPDPTCQEPDTGFRLKLSSIQGQKQAYFENTVGVV